MSALDIFILLSLAVGMIHGFTTGVIRQISSVISLVLGFLVALQLMDTVGDAIGEFMGVSQQAWPVIGFVTVFVAFHLCVIVLVKFFETVLEILKLTTANRILGSLAGALKAGLVLGIMFFALGYAGIPDGLTRSESVLYGPVAQSVPTTWNAVRGVFPEVEELSAKFSREVEKRVEKAAEPKSVVDQLLGNADEEVKKAVSDD
jgi:membrane protein required for colicin V production